VESILGIRALVDDNTRLGWRATVVFHGLSGITLDALEHGSDEPVMAVARGVMSTAR
jgi:hypothetical protein